MTQVLASVAGPLRRVLRCGNGTAAVEFALLALPLVGLVCGTMQLGYVMWTYSSLQYASERAARCAAVNASDCGTVAATQAYAAAQAALPGVQASNFSVTDSACGKQVSATASLSSIFTGLSTIQVTATGRACYPS